MSLIFLLFVLCFIGSVVSITKDDKIALLKIKKQIGNPDTLHSWSNGNNFCGEFGNAFFTGNFVFTGCDSITGRVTSFALQNITVVAPFPNAICDLTELDFISVFQCPGFYGPIPSCITKLSNLREFTVEYTSISGPVPDFHNNTKMTDIWLPHNHLSGTIPSSLSALTKLQLLDLSFNHLTGTIPPGLIHVSSSVLRLSNNNLTGEIPKCYGWVDFGTFDVANNQLSGDASFLFSKPSVIDYVNLANNSFTFDLTDIEASYLLYWLDLSHNNIYGKVPDSLVNAPYLAVLNLSFNRLCGEIPQGDKMWRFNAENFANNECLCGSPLPPCFNSAPAQAPF